jgi:Glycosyltransferase family 87/WD40-like Beta Propeller Repeat
MEAASTAIPKATRTQMAPSDAWRRWSERVLFAFLLTLFFVRGFIPAWGHVDSDFANYYLAARLYREGYPVERVYEWTWFQRQKDHFGIDRPLVGFIPSTLTSSLLVLPLSWMPALLANRCWLVLNLGLLPLIAALLKRITSLSWTRIGVIVFLAVAPLHSNFLLGQVHLFMLLLLTLAAWFYLTDREFSAGIVIAVAAALKIYPALFLLFFVLKRRWRAAAGLACGLAASLAISVSMFGMSAYRVYFREILPWGLRGEIIDPYSTGWDSLNALLRRLFIFEPELNPFPVAHLPHLYAFLHSLMHAVILVILLWAIVSSSGSQSRRKLEWSVFCFLLLLLSSEPLPYHFVVLILTAVLAVDYLLVRGQSGCATTIAVLYGIVCIPYTRFYLRNPQGWISVFFFPRLFWMLILGAALLWILITDNGKPLRSQLRSRSFAFAATSCIALSVVGFIFDVRHLSGQFDNYHSRVTTSIGSAIAMDPFATSDSVFYGALIPTFTAAHDAYAVHQLHKASTATFSGGGDWFHPTATMDDRLVLAEIANHNSKIVRLEPSGLTPSETIATAVNDAQQPTVSFDGRQMGFIREVRGRGSLWVRTLERPGTQTNLGAERQLVGPTYDVREAAFSPEGQIVFSSSRRDRYHLYSVDPQSPAVAELTFVDCSARYPSFSPDGKWMAFSCEQHGVWQLVTLNRQTSEQRQLTTADCNSITPAWTPNSTSLIYATDCARGLGITALSEIDVLSF